MSKNVLRTIVQNGEFLPYEDAKVHAMTPAMKYGLLVFEGIRAYPARRDGTTLLFRLGDHIDRLFQSMKLMRFEEKFSADRIRQDVLELMKRSKVQSSAHVRVTAYVDGEGEMHTSSPVSYCIAVSEASRKPRVTQGIRCQVSSWVRISDLTMSPRVKCSANYVNSRLARYQAVQDGYDDAILLNNLGKVSESTGACIFHVRKGKLATPDVTSGILESVTRDTVIVLAECLGLECVERSVDRTELYAADEVFVVGSAAEIVPVIGIDGIPVGAGAPGPITRRLQEAYFSVVSDIEGDKRGWLTPVAGTGVTQ